MRGQKQCLVHGKHPLSVYNYSEHHREMLLPHQNRNQELGKCLKAQYLTLIHILGL